MLVNLNYFLQLFHKEAKRNAKHHSFVRCSRNFYGDTFHDFSVRHFLAINPRRGKLIQQQWLVFKYCLFKSARIRNNLIDGRCYLSAEDNYNLWSAISEVGFLMTIRRHNNSLVWKTKDRKSLVYRASQLTALGAKCDIHEF